MVFFGWGRNSKEFPVSEQVRLLLTQNYFHFFFLLRWGWGTKYQLATWTEHGWALQPVTREDALIAANGVLPTFSLWSRYSLPGAIASGILIGLIVSLFSQV